MVSAHYMNFMYSLIGAAEPFFFVRIVCPLCPFLFIREFAFDLC
uniref:Uncharacterized protein n=1 Tax=Rhizophora mucronata TaxID=61149 RepID=A0A2P2N090_RHIMU